jgi:hypothetical protein
MRTHHTRFFTRIGRSTTLLLLLLLPFLGWGQGSETFTSLPLTGSGYSSATIVGNYTGDNGVTWNYLNARGDQPVTGKAITLRNASGATVYNTAVPGGLATLSFKYKKAFSNDVNATVAVNGTSVGTIATASTATQTFLLTGQVFTGNVVVSITVTSTGGQVAIDDIEWTGYTPANAPTIATLTPNTAVAGSGSVALTVDGTNFVSGSAIYFNNIPLTTTYVSPTQLTATIPAGSVASASVSPVTVRNTTNGVPSNPVNFTVTAATGSGAIGTPTYLAGPNATAASPGGAFCSNGGINLGVSFTTTGTFNAGNNFIVELSGPTGSFATPSASTTVAGVGTPSAPVSLAIPAGTASGDGYVIRVRSTSPVSTSALSVALIIVNNPQVTITPPITQTYTTGTPGVPFVAVESFGAISRQWQVGPTITGPFTSIPGATALTFSPTFNTPGTYFVNLVSTFAACGTKDSDNEAQVNVTSSAATFAASPVCATAAAPLDVTFTATGTYTASNTFTVQLSNASGSFAAPVTIGSVTNSLNTAQTVTTTIPAGTPTGAGYLIRVVSSGPAANTATSAALTIVSNPVVNIIPAAAQNIAPGANGTTIMAAETAIAGTTRVWQVATAAGGPYTSITPTQTGTSYTPNFATGGTYFVRVLSTFVGCGDVASTPVQINVTSPTPVVSSLSPNTAVVGGAGFTLTVNGSGFATGAVVNFNGAALATTFVNAGQLTATVPASALAATGSFPVTVTNPAPSSATSTAVTFTVTVPLTACLSEDFEGGAIPTGWLQSGVSINATAASTGAGGADLGTATATLTTPELSAPASITFTLGRTNNATAKTLLLEVSTSSATTGFTTVATYNNADVTSNGFTTFTVSLPSATAPSAWIRFRRNNTGNTSPWRLDNIAVGCGTPTTPRISVAAGSTVVPNAGSYGLGTVAPGSSSAATTFNILNTGGGTLTLSGTSAVAVTGNTADFTVTQPASTSVAGGSSVPFTVTFSPTSLGVKTITLTIANNDGSASRNPYVFTVRGTGGIVTPPATGNFATGELLLEEDFAYAPSAASVRTLTGWAAHSASGSGTPVRVVSGNITNPEYPVGTPGTNNQASSSGASEDVNRAFDRAAPVGSTTLYVSAVVNISQLFGSNYFLHLLDNTQPGETVARGKLFVSEVSASSYALGLSVSGSTVASATIGSDIYGVGDNLLVVIKYVTNPGGQDEASLFVFPATAAPATEPAVPAIGPLLETNSIGANTLNSVAFRQEGTTPFYTVDGLRVGTGWGSAVGKAAFPQAAGVINAGNYYNVTVNNSGQVTTTGPVNIENNLALTSGMVNTSAATLVTLYQGAGISGGSATSFVNGPLARGTGAGAATTVFPIGKGTNYRPLTLTATSQAAPSTYTAEQTEGNPGQNLGGALLRVSARRSFTVTSSNTTAGNFSGAITLSFGPDDYVNTPSSTDLVIAKRDGGTAGTWNSIGRGTATGADSGPGGAGVSGTLASGTFSDFSDFALGALNDLTSVNTFAAVNPLPVELTAFTAQRQSDKSVAVRWTTASERNSARFEVQRSLNSRDFVTVATVKAQGTSTKATAYASADATAPAAQLYYRLRQVDLDGTVAYSPIVNVAGISAAAAVLLYPNPAHSSISFATEAATSYRVLNQLGQAVLHGTTEAGTAKVGVEQLPTGLYFLELQTPAGRSVQKFEKE